ncbi:hypothetical protein ACH4TV_15040 [Streptomyces sp. NPDC020898]|uniref:hypothetical protein n=1 Tax=Streptomyces sp. NPDC020898 TaxID=3365101 RepID=UPI0037B70A10
MSKQQEELLEQIDKQFGEQFAKLFKYFDDKIDALDAKLDTKADAGRTYASLDAIVSRLDRDETERAAVTSQVDRHESMLQKVARKLGLN